METKLANGKSTSNGHMSPVWRPDLWLRDVCLVCQSAYQTDEQKTEHIASDVHIKRVKLYDFFSKESRSLKHSERPSVILNRYQHSQALVIGLECIHEFVMPFCSTPWWACSICYKADSTLDMLDEHLNSISHIRTYIDEFHPNFVVDDDMDRLTLIDRLYKVRLELLKEADGRLESPEVIDIDNDVTKQTAVEKLGIADEMNAIMQPYKSGEIFDGFNALHCKICHSAVITSDKDTKERCWLTHSSSSYHQRMQLIAATLQQLDSCKISAPRVAAESRQNEWTLNSNGVYIGPIAGLQYLLYFGTLPYCDLCYMVLDEQNVMEHFSSENHLIKFLSYNRPASMYTAMYLPEDARRSHMLSLLGCLGTDCSVGGSPRKVEVAHIPELVIANSNPIMANVPSLMPPCMSIGVENFCFWCPICWRVMKVPKEDNERIQLWTEHCTKSRKHFECAVRRDLFNFEDVNFVDIVTTLQLPAFKQLASWELVKMNNGMEIKIQHFTYIGLDFVVDDVLNNEIVCIACAEIFSRSDLSQLCLHIRSRNHLVQYLHTTDREMYNLIKSQQMQHAVDNLLIDYLRRSISSVGQIRVYNASLAVTAKSWGQLPYRKVQLANIDAEHRAAFELLVKIVDQLANDKAEQITLPIKDALQLCSVRIQTVADKNVLLYCKGCERILSVAGNAVEKGVWDEHLLGELHAKRADSLTKNKFDSAGFLVDEKPKFGATLIDQSGLKKKVVWRWKELTNEYEYVYKVVGLSDMIERRSSNAEMSVAEMDVYCTLCTAIISYSQEAVDEHIRSLTHIINYAYKYHQDHIAELEELEREYASDDGRSLRRHLALLLKDDCCAVANSQMRVYDPFNARKQRDLRIQKISMSAKQSQEERQRQKLKRIAIEKRRKLEKWLISKENKKKDAMLEEKVRKKNLDEKRKYLARLELKRICERRERDKLEECRRVKTAERKQEAEKEARERELDEKVKKERGKIKKTEEEKSRKKLEILAECAEEVDDMDPGWKKEAVKNEREFEREEFSVKIESEEGEKKSAEEVVGVVRLNEQQIQEEIERLRQEKAGIMEALSTMQNRCSREMELNRMIVTVPNTTDSTSPLPALRQRTVIDQSQSSSVYVSSQSLKMPPKNQIRPLFPKKASPGLHHCLVEPVPLLSIDLSDQQRKKKMEANLRAFESIETRELLIDYLWKQGGEMIPTDDIPERFNSDAAKLNGLLGLSTVYQVQCYDQPTFQSYFCSACSVWTIPSAMLEHLMTPEHRLAYLFRNYKMYHKSAMNQPNTTVRDQMLEQFAQQIWKLEGSGEVKYRLSCAVNYETVTRLWPQLARDLQSSLWKNASSIEQQSSTPPPGIEPERRKKHIEADKCVKHKTVKEYDKDGNKYEKGTSDQMKNEKRREMSLLREKQARSSSRKKDSPLSTSERTALLSSSRRRARRRSSSVRSRSRSRSRSLRLASSTFHHPTSSAHHHLSYAHPSTHHSHHLPSIRSSHSLRSPSNRPTTSSTKSKSNSHADMMESVRSVRRSPLRISKLLDSLHQVQSESGTWEDAAAAFLTKIGDKRGAERMKQHQCRDMSQSTAIGTTAGSERISAERSTRNRSSRESSSRRRSPSHPHYRHHRPSSASLSSSSRHRIESEHSHSSSRDTRAHRDTRSRVRTPESSHRKRYESSARKEQRSQEQQSKKKHPRESPSTITFDERIEQETGGGLLKVWEGLPEEIDRELSKNEAKKKLPTDEDIDRILAKRAKKAEQVKQQRDPKEDMRKLLGLIVTMQQECERRGNMLDESTIAQLYQEVGVSSSGMQSADSLLQQLCSLITNDSSSTGAINNAQSYDSNAAGSQLNLQSFGIAAASVDEQSGPASFVYPGAQILSEQSSDNIRLDNTSAQTAYAGYGDSFTQQGATEHSTCSWLNSVSTNREPLADDSATAALSGDTSDLGRLIEKISSITDVYAARQKLKKLAAKLIENERNVSSTNSVPSNDALRSSSLLSGDGGHQIARVKDKTGALSGAAGVSARSSIQASSSSINKRTNLKGTNKHEKSRRFVMAKTKKNPDYQHRQKLLDTKPGLSQWTGANNPANNTNLRTTTVATACGLSPSSSSLQQTPVDAWNTMGTVEKDIRSSSFINAPAITSNRLDNFDQNELNMRNDANAKKTLSRKERRAQRRAAFLAAKAVEIAEASTRAAVEPIELDDDINISDTSKDHGPSWQQHLTGDGDANGGCSDRTFDPDMVQRNGYLSSSIPSKTMSESNISSMVSNAFSSSAVEKTATWEDLGSNISALFNSINKKQQQTNDSKRVASCSSINKSDDARQRKVSSCMSTASTVHSSKALNNNNADSTNSNDNIKSDPHSSSQSTSTATVVTQYSAQPTKYSQPIITSNCMSSSSQMADFIFTNATQPLYTSTIGVENSLATVCAPTTSLMQQPQQQVLYDGSTTTVPQFDSTTVHAIYGGVGRVTQDPYYAACSLQQPPSSLTPLGFQVMPAVNLEQPPPPSIQPNNVYGGTYYSSYPPYQQY